MIEKVEPLKAFQMNLKRLTHEKGISYTHINSMMAGKSNPTLYTAVQIAKALGVKLEDLMKGAEY